MLGTYYNEIDGFCAAWLRNLIAANLIVPGDVDERSIVDVSPDDVRGYDQCHWFAGIGVWSYALRLAGWPDDRPVWTASLPCQPFSAAGKKGGHADERHLAPVWLRLVEECRPAIAIGEQVGAAVGMGWLDALAIRLEQLQYAVGAVVFPACSVGAPHIRERLYWVAQSAHISLNGSGRARQGWRHEHPNRRPTDGLAESAGEQDIAAATGRFHAQSGKRRPTDGMAHADAAGSILERRGGLSGNGHASRRDDADRCGEPDGAIGADGMGDASGPRLEGLSGHGNDRHEPRWERTQPTRSTAAAGALNGFWSDAIRLPCRDGKARPVGAGIIPLVRSAKSCIEPLANVAAEGMGRGGNLGLPFDANNTAEGRVQRLRGYGNALVAEQAKEFIAAVMECI